MLVFEKHCVIFAPSSSPQFNKAPLTLFSPVQMATPGRRLCTSGRGAQLRLGTSAPGGSTSSPSWAWETPLRSSGPSQVRKQSILFANKPRLCYSVKAHWTHVLCKRRPAFAGRSCVSEAISRTCDGCGGIAIPRVLHGTTFTSGMVHLIWWRQDGAGSSP